MFRIQFSSSVQLVEGFMAHSKFYTLIFANPWLLVLYQSTVLCEVHLLAGLETENNCLWGRLRSSSSSVPIRQTANKMAFYFNPKLEMIPAQFPFGARDESQRTSAGCWNHRYTSLRCFRKACYRVLLPLWIIHRLDNRETSDSWVLKCLFCFFANRIVELSQAVLVWEERNSSDPHAWRGLRKSYKSKYLKNQNSYISLNSGCHQLNFHRNQHSHTRRWE